VVVVLAGALALPTTASVKAAPSFSPETLVVPANRITGVDTTQSLEAGALYRAVAWGTFDYGVADFQIADAECTTDRTNFNPLRAFEPPLPAWSRQRYAFYGSADLSRPDGYTVVNTDLRDPDPSDDPIDLYVDNRNVEWAAVGVSTSSGPSPLGCHEGDPGSTPHVYEHYFVPTHTGPVNFRIFDPYYADNGAPGVNGENTLEVFVSEVARTDVTPGRHVETVLVSPENADASSRPLAEDRAYLLVARGMWSYKTLWDLADAACTRTEFDPTYVRERYTDRTGSLWIDDAPAEWVPLVPAQVWARTRPSGSPVTATSQGCDGLSHSYRLTVMGNGPPVGFSLPDPPTTPDGLSTGHLSVDIFEIA
jgi:hypothetical protein